MRNYGDITKISGYEVPPVDVVIGGSPCQDLSVAGLRKGLAGRRSGLFMDQIRIVKEMRENDRMHGRTGDDVRPGFMVWENVCGAFSSNGGKDFLAVLEETAHIADENAVIPEPPQGKWRNAGVIMGDGWSIAWRVHDAQFWGVPQRRRLTPLECERLQGFPSELKLDVSKMTKDEYIAYNILEGNIIVDAEAGKVFRTRGPGGVKLEKPQEMSGSDCHGYLVVKISNGTTKMTCRVHRIIWISKHGVIPDGYCIDHVNSNKKDNRISNLQLLTPQENSTKASIDGLYATGEDNGATKLSPDLWDEIAYLHHCEGKTMRQLAEVYGISKSRIQQIVKEVGWTDIGDWTDDKGKKHKTTDSNRYKALGNSIALPFWKYLLKRISAEYERDATMASLFDGIGGFPYLWEQINGKGSCKWISEIEPFCCALAEKRFS